MPIRPLAVLCASMLTACAASPRIAPSSFPKTPEPPAEALQPCRPTVFPLSAMASADAERAIRAADIDLADCDAKRRALVAAWPR